MTLYFFSHFISMFLLPPGFIILIELVGFLLLFTKRFFVVGKILIFIQLTTLCLLSIPVVTQLLFDPLQRKYSVLQPNALHKDVNDAAIIVLGGGYTVKPEYDYKRSLNEVTLDRLRYAAFLYEHTHAPIIVSGGGKDDTYSEAALMRDVLIQSFHVPVTWLEDKSINTAEEAKYSLSYLVQHHIDTIYLVTNAWHMPRSVAIFKHFFRGSGIKIIPAPMGYVTLSSEQRGLNYLPIASAQCTVAISEYLGIAWYRLRYGM